MNVLDAHRLKALEAENTKPKKAAGQLDARNRYHVRDTQGKVKAGGRRAAVGWSGHERAPNITLLGMSASTPRYEPRYNGNAALRKRLNELTGQHRRTASACSTAGCTSTARHQREAHLPDHRIYRDAGLMVRKRRRKELPVPERWPPVRPIQPNEVWNMDFVFDELTNGWPVNTLTVPRPARTSMRSAVRSGRISQFAGGTRAGDAGLVGWRKWMSGKAIMPRPLQLLASAPDGMTLVACEYVRAWG